MKQMVIGIAAHVDAGKTTLSEAILAATEAIPCAGRVDHGDTLLDDTPMEQQRGITIFANAATFKVGASSFTLIDTPGHVDFSAEAEQAFILMDAAVLVISGSGGVQSHTRTLWRLLKEYEIPVFIFVTKTDSPIFNRDDILNDIQEGLTEKAYPFDMVEDTEGLALVDEFLLDAFTQRGVLTKEDITDAINRRKLFPVFFGSGLKQQGITDFVRALDAYTVNPYKEEYKEPFECIVWKVRNDDVSAGNRRTFIKVLRGALKPRQEIIYLNRVNDDVVTEKINEIRLYQGNKYARAEEATPGMICCITGVSGARSGDYLYDPGVSLTREKTTVRELNSHGFLQYRMLLPEETDIHGFLPELRLLEEENPSFRIKLSDASDEIFVVLSGDMGLDILKERILQRFKVAVDFDEGSVAFCETITGPAIGIGHFEPLRHYAEVHLLLEPLLPGEGIQYGSTVPVDVLERHWQRLIIGELKKAALTGVLTGSPVTDIRITLVAGKAHKKHTSGGDFREAALRAFRNGLMKTSSVLLEPAVSFNISAPQNCCGRILTDLQRKSCTPHTPLSDGKSFTLSGKGPLSELRNYPVNLRIITGGEGTFDYRNDGYMICHNPEEVIDDIGYDPDRDVKHPSASVFCNHGESNIVPWDKVYEMAHCSTSPVTGGKASSVFVSSGYSGKASVSDAELEAIMLKEFGPVKRPVYSRAKQDDRVCYRDKRSLYDKGKLLIVDGYNMIFGWERLSELSEKSIADAREALAGSLMQYHIMEKTDIILVFDGYRVHDNIGSDTEEQGIRIVYTKEGLTADAWIERYLHSLAPGYLVRVASSDALIQVSAVSSGILRMSAKELESEIYLMEKRFEAMLTRFNQRNERLRNMPHSAGVGKVKSEKLKVKSGMKV